MSKEDSFTNSAMNQSQFLEAREKSRVHGVIGYGFASHWLKNWRDPFEPITKRSNRNHVITFYSQLKTALILGENQSKRSLDFIMVRITYPNG